MCYKLVSILSLSKDVFSIATKAVFTVTILVLAMNVLTVTVSLLANNLLPKLF